MLRGITAGQASECQRTSSERGSETARAERVSRLVWAGWLVRAGGPARVGNGSIHGPILQTMRWPPGKSRLLPPPQTPCAYYGIGMTDDNGGSYSDRLAQAVPAAPGESPSAAGAPADTAPASDALAAALHPAVSVRTVHAVDVLVIGGGQAGICAAYELQQRGFTGFAGALGRDDGVTKWRKKPPLGTYLVLDAEHAPGGAWQHRWRSLKMADVHHIADLPGMPVGEVDPNAAARMFVPAYFAEFEYDNDLAVIRPVRVLSVLSAGERLAVHTTAGIWLARFIVNCTGTWSHPFLPAYPGASEFRGRQYHTQNYPGPEKFWKQRVLVVGSGVSAVEHVTELAQEAKKVRWVSRTEPRWREWPVAESERVLAPEEDPAVTARLRARAQAGLALLPVVAEAGLPLTAQRQALIKAGVLKRRPMFERLDAEGAWWGTKHERFDAIIWATGFLPALSHLDPLALRTPKGGIQLEGTHAAKDPRVFLLGYGASASILGARRDARIVGREIKHRVLRERAQAARNQALHAANLAG